MYDAAHTLLSVDWWGLPVIDRAKPAYLRHLVQVDAVIQVHDRRQNLQLEQRGLVVGLQLDGALELVLGRLVVSDSAHDESPYKPVVGLIRFGKNRLLDLLNCLAHLTLLVEGKGPVAEAEMVAVWIVLARHRAGVYRLRVELMHVVDECEVVVCREVVRIEVGAELEMLDCGVVSCNLEVCEAEVVLELSVVGLELAGLLEGFEGLCVVVHLVESHTQIEEPFRRLAIHPLQLLNRRDFELVPLLVLYELDGPLFKLTFDTRVMVLWVSLLLLGLPLGLSTHFVEVASVAARAEA